MPKVSPTQNNFTAGELSPLVQGRFDVAKYSNAAKTLENILIHQAGGGQRRPGTKYVAEVKTSSLKTRLITFEFSTTQTYILEFGNEYIRFYRNQGQIQSASAYELSTPYQTADLFDLQFAQDADTMWITHPGYKPRKLTRTAHTTWTLTKYEPTGDPFGASKAISAATAAEPVVVTTAEHGYSDGDRVLITEVEGMTQINDIVFMVDVLSSTTFGLYDEEGNAIDGQAYDAYTGSAGISENVDEFPSCVAMFEQRIFLANSNNDPQKIWGSKSGDFEVLTPGSDAGDGFVYVIASDKVNAIRWLKPIGKSLQMGTLGATFSMTSGSDAVAITPTNVSIKRDTTYGAANILPETIGNFIYYVERDLNHLRELGFSFDIDAQQALDMTILSDHIAKAADPLNTDGFTQIAYQQSPVSRLWCVRNDGQLAVLTRQIDQEVIGWSREVSGSDSLSNGVYESVAIIPTDGGDDEVWVIVKRYIGGEYVRYVEYFMPESFDHQQDAFFVDSGLSLDSPKTITGVSTKTVIDDMEYASDTAAQAAYVSSDAGYESDLKYWSKLENAGDITSPQVGPDGTVDGSPTYPACKFNKGIYVNANAEGFYFANDPTTVSGDKGVIEFWLKPDYNLVNGVPADSMGHRFVDYTTAGNAFMWFYIHDSNGIVLYRNDDSNTPVSVSDTASDWIAGDLVHIAFVWDKDAGFDGAKTMALYINGVETASITTAFGTFTNDTSDIYVGEEVGQTLPIDSILDNLKIWNVGRTDFSDKDTESSAPTLQCYSEGTIKEQGDYSLKIIAQKTDSLNDYLTGTLASAANLTGAEEIKFKVRASRTGSNFKIGFYDSGGTTTEHIVNIAVADTWQEETVDISTVDNGNKDDITKVIITILNADAINTFYTDNIYSPTGIVTVTAEAHGFSDDDEIKIVDIVGMTELNNRSFVVADDETDTFSLKDSGGSYIDGSDYTVYISGGEVRKKVTEIEGLTHLAGEEVAILADGVAVTTKIVNSDGEITLDASASLVHAGLPYTSDIELLPMPEGSATGTAVGKIQRIYKIIMKIYRSLSLQFGPDADNLLTLAQTSLFTGDKVIEYPGDWDRTGAVLIRQSQPLPLNVLSVTLISEVVDD